MPAPLDFSQKVNHALSHLYDPDILRNHPLLSLLGLNAQPNPATLLRETIIHTIEELKPSSNVPIESRTWRVYKILHMRYIQQMEQEQTAHQIGVGVRHLRREQSAAVTALADALYQKLKPQPSTPERAKDAMPETNVMAEEFAWLQKNYQDETANLFELIQVALQRVEPLAGSKAILLENQVPAQLPQFKILPAALRQVLISMTTYLINRMSDGKISFHAAPFEQSIELCVSASSKRAFLPETPNSQESLRSIHMLLGKFSPNLVVDSSDKQITFRLRLPAQRNIHVLMVDDNQSVAELFQRYTFGTEFSIEYLADPNQIFPLCESFQPQIILLDIMIPQIDGWELLGRIRQHPDTQHIPIIVCSVLPERELALALGASAHLPKPVKRSELVAALKRAVSEQAW